MITSLPMNITLADKESVQTARAAYDELTEAQKALIGQETLGKLTAAEAKIAELEADQAAEKQANSFKTAHAGVLGKTVDTIAISDKESVNTALAAYEELSAAVKGKLTSEKALLDSLLTEIGELEKAEADKEAAKAVIDMIEAFPENLTLDHKAAVVAARDAYGKLTKAQKVLIGKETLDKLTTAEAKIDKLEADQAATEEANKFKTIYATALGLTDDTVTIGDKGAVNAALTAYRQISQAAKTKLTAEKTLLDSLLAKIGQLEIEAANQVAAQAVIDVINKLPAAEELTLGDKEAVQTARTAYDELTGVQKVLIEQETLDKLKAAETKIAELEADQAAEKEANSFKTAHADVLVKTVDTIAISDKESVKAALAAYEELSAAAKAKLTSEKTLLDSLLTKIVELELTVDEIGDETINGLNIVNRNYTDNSIKKDDIGGVTLKIRGEDVTKAFTFKFYDRENGTEVTTFDLSNGASTYKVFMKATSEKYKNISEYVFFKYRSVTIENNEKYYTIEDALNIAEKGTIYVKYDTSFASSGVSQEVYGSSTFTLKKDVTLLLPYDSTMSLGLEDTGGGNGAGITRNSAYVTLTMPKDINLNIDGTLVVNGKRSAGTPRAGYITGKNYAQVDMLEDSSITVKDGGTLNSIGFIYGAGTMEAKPGSKIYDTLLVTDFRGGSITSNVYDEVFPFDQYSFHNIEVPLTINQGAYYYARAAMYAGGSYARSIVPIIGKEGDASLITLISGKINKYFDTSTGKVTLDFDGDARVNDLEMKVYVSVNTKDKEMPFPGNFQLNVKNGSTLTLDAGVKLLPGAGLYIEDGADFIITENGRLMIYDANEYSQSRGYPMEYKNYYRVEPNYTHSFITPANFTLNGTLTVEGGIAGKVNTESISTITISPSASTELNIKHVEGGGGITSNIYSLKAAKGTEVNAVGTYKISKDAELWTTTINFVKNDGSGKITSIEQRYGENYIFPEWTDESIIWYSEKDGGIPLVLTKVNIILYDTIYARRDAETKTITFETNGGETINPYKVPISSSINPNADFIPIKANATFLGWYEDPNFINPYSPNKKITEDSTIYARWAEGGIKITVEASKTTLTNNDIIDVIATIKDGNGNPLTGIKIVFSGGAGEWGETNHITDGNGQATTNYKGINGAPNKTSILKETLKVTENTSGLWESGTIDVTVQANFSCPFVYSYDGEDYHFEHEAIPFAVNSALETTSYGTFRKLKEIDGKYHVRVAEMLDEKSFVNGFKLIMVDYPTEADIAEVFMDIYGNPHTIKNKELPLDFIDSNGNSYLDEITNKGQLVTSDYSKLYQGEYVTSYEATFNKPKVHSKTAKLMIRTQKTNLITQSWDWVMDKLDAVNNMWWIEKIMELPEYQDKFVDFINMVNLKVELWDGTKWVNQGEIKAGRHMLEEFLIPLDLSIINDQVDEIKVRLTSGTGFFEIDQISIDYSEDNIINIVELEPETALLNGEEDVKPIIEDFNNDNRAKMKKGDKIDLVYNAPVLPEGHERGFGVALKGYYHADPDSKENETVSSWDGLDYDDIIETLNNMPDEDAIEIMPTFLWMCDLIDSLYKAPLEEKIKRVIVDYILPWLD